jgi:pimeloyl-ACP methyl ester carboxylesterase
MRDQTTADGTTTFDDVGSGRPVVLLHAFPLSRQMWRPQLDGLQRSCRVIVPDLRGFGGSRAFTGTPSVEQMADDVAALLDHLALQTAVIGGLSMGGYVALAFARRHANRLQGLILADTRAEADDAEGRANRDKLIAFTRSHPASDVIEQMLPKLISPETATNRPAIGKEVRAIASVQAPAAIVAALEALRDRPDATPTLRQITVPTLILVGRDDALTPPARSEAMASQIPRATLVTIVGAGHLSNLEQPELFNNAVRAYLEGLAD